MNSIRLCAFTLMVSAVSGPAAEEQLPPKAESEPARPKTEKPSAAAGAATADESKAATRKAAEAALKNAGKIHMCLIAFAADHRGAFPQGPFSNEAFRQLFTARLVIKESLFEIPGHEIHGGQPADEKLGEPQDYAQALAAGECAWSYVNGLTSRSGPELPLFFSHLKDKKSGTVFTVIMPYSGSGYIVESKDGVPRVDAGDKIIDVLSAAYGTDPSKIVDPLPRPQEREENVK